MKKFYILSLCALLGASTAMADGHFKTKKGAPRKSILKTEAAAPIWRAESQTDFLYMDGEWMELGTITFKYDANGNAIQQDIDEDGFLTKVVTEYNENGKPVSIFSTVNEGDGWENSSKRTYTYDPIVKDYYIKRLGFDWVDGEWVRNYYCETNDITRNNNGNITEIIKLLPFMDEMVPAYKATWGYERATGIANEFNYYVYDAYAETPTWVLDDDLSYRNIIWESTDGQMTGTSMSEFLQGNNKIKYCDVYYQDNLDGHFIVEYSAEKPGEYLVKETFTDKTVIGATSQKELLDNYGSYRLTDSEYFDEDGQPTEEPTYVSIQEVTYDEHGNAIQDVIYETFEGITEMILGSKAEYIYDENGNPKEVTISSYDYDTEEYIPESKTVYGDYIDASAGIANITADSATDGFSVYNLQGILVKRAVSADELTTLPSGLYIVNGRKQIIRN